MENNISVHKAIQLIDRPVFSTREISALCGSSLSSASQALGRLEKEDLLTRAARGIWCVTTDPRFTPFQLVPFLAGNHQAYISFFSAFDKIRSVGYPDGGLLGRRMQEPHVSQSLFHRGVTVQMFVVAFTIAAGLLVGNTIVQPKATL